jgi:OFA family oxalate/formate antiporter-like MFS transporter
MQATPPKRWPQLLTGALVFILVGVIYAWSLFAAIFKTSFPAWSNKDLATTFTLIMGFFCLGNFAAGFLARRFSPRQIFLLSALLNAAGFFGVSLIQVDTLWLLYLSYGVVGSFGVGLAYNQVLSTVTRWFPEKVGLISGTLMMSWACSTLILGLGADALCHVISWRIVFLGLGLVSSAALVVAALVLKAPGPEVQLPRKPAGPDGAPATLELTPLEMIRTSAFWLFFIWGVLLLIAVYGVMGNVKQCVLDVDSKAKTMATASVTLLAIANGLGRFMFGSLYDRLGRIRTMTAGTLLLMLSSGFMIAAFKTRSIPVMLGGVVLTGLAYGGVPPTSSAFVVDYFGARDYSMKFGLVNLFIFIGAFGSALAGLVKDTAGSFENLFYVLILLCAVALLLNLGIRKPRLKVAPGDPEGLSQAQ